MNMKRKLLGVAVASVLGTGTASAVHLSETGTGQVALFPYYTTQAANGNAYDTYVSITNTTGTAKAVKIRFREARNSREVLDFNIYLSPQDVWVGAVSADDGGGAKITAYDNSCTVPVTSGGRNIKTNGIPFRSYNYTDVTSLGGADNRDGAGLGIGRTKEGYFEVIEMGEPTGVIPTSLGAITDRSFAGAILHDADGVPASCAAVVDAWRRTSGEQDSYFDENTRLSSPTGGIMASAVLINPQNGAAYTIEPTMLADWSSQEIHSYPGSEAPALSDVLPTTSYVYSGNQVVVSNWSQDMDAVSAVLMRNAVMNEFTINDTISNSTRTDWVVTFPTKWNYVSVGDPLPDSGVTRSPFTAEWEYTSLNGTDGGACEKVDVTMYDREEGTYEDPLDGDVDFSPTLPGKPNEGKVLCNEANVISFAPSSVDKDTYVGVLGSSVQRTIPGHAGDKYGWAIMEFTGANATGTGVELVDEGGRPYYGLPVIGMSITTRTGSNIVPGVNGNYGNAVVHKYNRSIGQ